MKNIPYSRQTIDQSDIDAVRVVLESDFLTQGPVLPRFEAEVASFCQVKAAVAVNSATSALHLACMALGVGPGDEVWTSPNSFVASANCALYCGAEVNFIDIEPDTLNLSAKRLEERLLERKSSGARLPKVVIPVHFAGLSCDMREVRRLANIYGFAVIEDASHAIGSLHQSDPVGSCRFSDITVFSFHPVKIITTGEGGMALTNSGALERRMRALRAHGITREPNEMTEPSHGPWHYQMQALGFNYRMTDIHAALGLSQMQRIEALVTKRNALAAEYKRLFRLSSLEQLGLSYQACQDASQEHRSAYHLFVVRVPNNRRSDVFHRLKEAGYGVNVHYIPIHLQPFYQQLGFKEGDFPESERYYSEAISLPLYPGLSELDIQEVVRLLEEALSVAPN